MKLTLRDQAALSGLWGCVFLFIAPIALGFWVYWSDNTAVAMLFMAGLMALASFAIGGYFFADAAKKLHQHSQAVVGQRRREDA